MIRILVFGGVLSLYVGATVGRAESPFAELTWRSTATNEDALAQELARLYVTLYNTGNLLLRPATVGEPATLEATLRDQNLFFGSHFPVEIDALLCDVNPELCSRRLTEATPDERVNVARHVGGYKPSRGNWAVVAGTEVRLPDYDLGTVTTLGRVEVPADWTPDMFLASDDVDCSAWKTNCADVVRRFNPSLIKAPSLSVSSVTVPVLRLDTSIRLSPDASSRYSDLLSSIAAATVSAPETPTTETIVGFSPNWESDLATKSGGDVAIDALGGNLLPVGRAIGYKASSEAHFQDQKKLFELANHPFGKDKELPDLSARSIMVVVIDEGISARHCDWLEAFTVVDGELEALPPFADLAGSAAPDCSAVTDGSNLTFNDHPFGIGGIIASQQNGNGIVGFNPNAKLAFIEFQQDQPANVQIAALVNQLQTSIPQEARVANLSFGVEIDLGNPRAVKNALSIHNDTVLFVVAAGNEGLDFSANCPMLPACELDLDNVITVVGLDAQDDDPALWKTGTEGSNHSPRFDIAAVADGVFTTTSQDHFALLEGTSFAAPQVAATASLIIAAGEKVYAGEINTRIQPKVIRDRLVYTADFFPKLQNDVFAGRLNVERAISVSEAQFELKDGRRITGNVQTFPRWYTCPTEADPDEVESHSWWKLRRIMFDGTRNSWMVYRHKDGPEGGRYSVLERTDWCTIGASDPKIVVLTAEGETISFVITDVVDYTSRLFD